MRGGAAGEPADGLCDGNPAGDRGANPDTQPDTQPDPVPAAHLDVGGIGVVVAQERLSLRQEPGLDSAVLSEQLLPGERFGILEGPVSASDLAWYRVRLGQLEGWAPVAPPDGVAWMASVENGPVALVKEVGDPALPQISWPIRRAARRGN